MPQLIAIVIALMAFAAPATACDAICVALKKAAESAPYVTRPAAKASGPQACLTLDPKDPRGEVVLAIHYAMGRPIFSTRWRKGAAFATGGAKRVPMICFDKKRLEGATAIMVCNQDVMVFIRSDEKLTLLRTRGRNPPETPVCMKGKAECSGT